MSSHADTIREALALPSGHNYASTMARSKMQDDAHSALDALLAENQLARTVSLTNARLLDEAEAENQRLREKASEAFAGLETLRGYTHNLADGCEPSLNRGKHFTAHVDSLQDTLREALAGDGE